MSIKSIFKPTKEKVKATILLLAVMYVAAIINGFVTVQLIPESLTTDPPTHEEVLNNPEISRTMLWFTIKVIIANILIYGTLLYVSLSFILRDKK